MASGVSKSRWYDFAGVLFRGRRAKLLAELLYWKYRQWREGVLGNEHFLYFFTTHFGFGIDDYADSEILDVGCGPRGSLLWATHAVRAVGLDPLADYYRRMHNIPGNMEFVQGNAESMPFADSSFDYVSSFNSLDHVDSPDAAIAEIKRVLRPGGYFLLLTEIHLRPALCEPSAFGWDIVSRFEPEFELVDRKEYEGAHLYAAIRRGQPFNHADRRERYGVLSALFVKRSSHDTM